MRTKGLVQVSFIVFTVAWSALARAETIIPFFKAICVSSLALDGECFQTAEEAGTLGCSRYYGKNFAYAIPGGTAIDYHTIYCQDGAGNIYQDFTADPFSACAIPRDYTPLGENSCRLLSPIDESQHRGRQCHTEGNPVTITIGNKFQSEQLITTGVPELSLVIYYNHTEQGLSRSIGQFWFHNFESKVLVDPGYLDSGAVVRRSDGRTFIFNHDNGVWTANGATTATLQPIYDASVLAGWLFITPDNHIETYNLNGQIQSIRSPSGMVLTIEYDSLNRVDRVVAVSGQFLQFSYSTGLGQIPRVSAVSDSIGSTVKFNYSEGGQLLSVTLPDDTALDDSDNPVRLYHYEHPNNGKHLTGITDENGDRIATWTYNGYSDFGHVTSSEHYNGAERITFDDANFGDQYDPRLVTTNVFGKQTTYHFTVINGVRKVSQVEGHPSANCAAANKDYTYDLLGRLLSKTDWKGNTTTYMHNTRGQEVSRTEASGTDDARTITTEWHPTFNLRTKVTEPDRETIYTYDPDGNLLSVLTQDKKNP